MQDRYACYHETAQRLVADRGASEVKPSCGAFNACLAARGYLQSKDGNLEVPASAKWRVTNVPPDQRIVQFPPADRAAGSAVVQK
jgi:hypothetical protein